MPVLICFSALVVLFASGCGNYTDQTRLAREEFYSGKYTEAAKILEKEAHEEGVNQLLYLLDRATALHQAGDFEESIKEFALAEKVADLKDHTSISTEAATLLTNDKILPYKGEDFEKILIPQYQALNYLFLKKKEDALVECRRVNHKTQVYISAGMKSFKLSPMAVYLAAIMYEDSREWNDAYVDYQQTQKLLPVLPGLGEDLYRLAWKNKIFDGPLGTEHWVSEYQISVEDQKRIRKTFDDPEIVVIVESGQSPEKKPHPNWHALPRYVPRDESVRNATVLVEGVPVGQTSVLFDVETTAYETLEEKIAGIIAKKVAGVVAKEVVSDQVGRRTKNPLLEGLVRMGLYYLDQADLRSWLTLPQNFQVLRFRVEKNKTYHVGLQKGGLERIVIFNEKPGQRAFLHFRVIE